jgi:hypothetical protein
MGVYRAKLYRVLFAVHPDEKHTGQSLYRAFSCLCCAPGAHGKSRVSGSVYQEIAAGHPLAVVRLLSKALFPA